MGKVQYFDNNNRIQFHGDIADYQINSMTATRFVLQYDPAVLGPIGEQDAFRVQFIVANGVVETREEGPNVGEQHYTAGTLKKVNLFDDSGNLLMQISKLNISMTYVSTMIQVGEGWTAVNHIVGAGHEFYGSDRAVANDPDEGDNITTGHGNDKVFAGKGDDWIFDTGGRDTYNGGAGEDWVAYNNHRWALPGASDGIIARLDNGYIIGTDGLRDTVKNIERVSGSMFDDRMIGNFKDNRFEGLAGNDEFNGRGGWDEVRYGGKEWLGGLSGVRVNLATGTARDEWGNIDTLKSIEEVHGSDTQDVLRDNNRDNWFDGNDGDDWLFFGRGDDGAEGGAGADKFVYRGDVFGDDYIHDFEDGIDLLKIENAPSFAALTVLADGNDTLVQWNGNEVRLNNVTSTDIDADDFIF